MVFFYCGPLPVAKVRHLVESKFASLPTHQVSHLYPVDSLPARPFDLRRDDEDNHQAHTLMGAIIPSIYSPERYALSLLNNILGGPGMNSRLNVALRERRGLVYSVDSSTALYSDVGLLSIYCGSNPEDRDRCVRLIKGQLRRIADTPLSPRALNAARRQYLGQQIVASASIEQTVLGAARSMLFLGEVITRDRVADILRSLTPADIAKAAESLSPDRFSILTLG